MLATISGIKSASRAPRGAFIEISVKRIEIESTKPITATI
jgi:hypothetical protein